MDLSTLEENIKCNKCKELFNEDSRGPRVLHCGHTYCRSCLEKILLQNPKCPACEAKIDVESADLIPINDVLQSLISSVKKAGASSLIEPVPSTRKLASVGYCSDHFYFKELRCMSCESWICAVCGIMNHKLCKTLLVKDALKEMEKQASQTVENELESFNIISLQIAGYLKILKKEREDLIEEIKKKENQLQDKEKCIKDLELKISEGTKFCEKLKNVSTTENSSDDKEFSKARNELDELLDTGKKQLAQLEALESLVPHSIESLRYFCEIQLVYVVENQAKPLYGKVQVKEGQVWISSFQSIKPKARLIPFRELLSVFGESSELPKKAFFQLTRIFGSDPGVDIVVETDGDSLRSKNFILSCSALKGQGYKGASFTKKKNTPKKFKFDFSFGYSNQLTIHPASQATANQTAIPNESLPNQPKESQSTKSREDQSNQPIGQTNQPIGQSNQPIGQSNQPIGQSNQPIGHSNQPIGHSNQPKGHSDQPKGHSDQPKDGQTYPLYYLTMYRPQHPVVEGISADELLVFDRNGLVLSMAENPLPFGNSSFIGKSFPLISGTTSGLFAASSSQTASKTSPIFVSAFSPATTTKSSSIFGSPFSPEITSGNSTYFGNSTSGTALGSVTNSGNSTLCDNSATFGDPTSLSSAIMLGNSTQPQYKIGVVISGFPKLMKLNQKSLTIRNCGIII